MAKCSGKGASGMKGKHMMPGGDKPIGRATAVKYGWKPPKGGGAPMKAKKGR